MKIWCDVCSKKKASVFCCADEAALCDDCDSRVHQANKLASKHQRFSLLQPPSSQSPLCDICQEKKALVFCQQDRAILCRDCDVPIHAANEMTQNHNRFLLTGVKLSGLSSTTTTKSTAKTSKISAKSDSESSGYGSVPDFPFVNFKAQSTADPTINLDGGACGSTSSISEYLIDILPGWQVDDLLDSSSDPNPLFFKGCENDVMFVDPILNSSYGNMGLWVPQAPNLPQQPSLFSSGVSRRRMDDGFTVPEINQQFAGSKRSRTLY